MLQPNPVWAHVPLDGSARVLVNVIDEDLSYDDPIGTFVISPESLLAAAESGVVYQVRVAEQTQNAVLFVGVLVIGE